MRNKLTALTIKKSPDGRLQDGAGLFLIKKGDGGRWIYRYQLHKRRRDMGLGSLPAVSLATARQERDRWAALVAKGIDPVSERQRLELEAERERNRDDPTFSDLTDMVFQARRATLKGDGLAGRWMSPLTTHIIPVVGSRPVSQLTAIHVRDALSPIWRTKHVTAARALQRVKIVLEGGKRMGLQSDPEIAATARYLLGDHVHTPVPIPATSWQEIPRLFSRLEGRGTAAECLRFMILTSVRMAGCRGARFSEVDGDVWTVPAARMKGQLGKTPDFAVPLSAPAAEIIAAARLTFDDLMFPGMNRRKPISDAALEKHLRELGETGRPHGFRTSFRTWVQDTDPRNFEVAETALAHRVGTTVERSYARSDLLDQRRVLAEKWGRFVTGEAAAVVGMDGRAV